jgi:tetratricopeptide (TPR) repeat protein
VDLAEAAADTPALIDGYFWRGCCMLELGIAEPYAGIEAWARLGEKVKRPFELSLNAMVRAMLAFMRGRFEDSERLAQEAFAIGQRLQTQAAAGVFGLQMFVLRREQGRLKEVEPAIRVFIQQHSAAAAWRPGLAVLYSELGRTAEARAEFENLAQNDFVDLPRDALWTGTMTYLVDVCTYLGDRARADLLYQILLPFAKHNVVVGTGAACYGAFARYLAALAATLERWDDAERHYEDALTMNARMDARPWLAHTREQYANMLLARNQSGDRDKAAALLAAALLITRELGMRSLEERITTEMMRMKAGLH